MSRRPVPTVTKVLRGNPGCRALPGPGEEPQPSELIGLGEPPVCLGTYGAEEWHRAGPILIGLKLLTEADLLAFLAYCMQVDIMIQAKLDIDRDGMTIRGGRDGRGVVRNPALAAFASASSAVVRYAAEFGMTPSSRSRMRLPTDKEPTLGELLAEDDDEDAM